MIVAAAAATASLLPMGAPVLISLAVAACTGSSPGSPAKEPATPAAGTSSRTVPPGGLGTYIRAASGDLSTALTLNADGRYTQTAAGGTIDGRWSFRNGKITFTETGGGDCTGQRGTYRWSFASKRLTLTVASDPCQPRTNDFPAAPWRRRS